MKKKIVLVLLILSVWVSATRSQMRVHLIDVGQGLATLVEFPCGAILIDAGGEKNDLFNSSEMLKDYLETFFDRRTDLNHTLQAVYLTHPHADHTRGVTLLLEEPFKIKNAITDGLESGSGKWGQIKLHRAAQDGDNTETTNDDIGLEAVTVPEIGSNGFTNAIIDPVNCNGTNPVIKVLWGALPSTPAGWSNDDFKNGNNHSLVIKIEYGTSSLLIIGDLEDVAQANLVAKYSGTTMLDSDVYLVGHHGSKNGTSQALIDKITPQMALIACGDPQREIPFTAWKFGHPNKMIMDRLKARVTKTRPLINVRVGDGATRFLDYPLSKAIYATGWDGDVLLEADNAGNWKKIENGIVPTLVNINTASLTELQTLPGIGITKAQAIIDFRTQHGNFASIDALDNVPGIGPATINLLRPYVTI